MKSRSLWLFFLLPLLVCLVACGQRMSGNDDILEGSIVATTEDSIFLYRQEGLIRSQVAAAALIQNGDSARFAMAVDTLPAGWYFLGKAPNQLSQVLLRDGAHVVVAGDLSRNGMGVRRGQAHLSWLAAEARYYQLYQASTAIERMARMSLGQGEQQNYLDYAKLALAEYDVLAAWMDSLQAQDPWLAWEFRLRTIPPFLPLTGDASNEAAFEAYDTYWRDLLRQLDREAARYPGLIQGLQTWMNLQRREEDWALPALRQSRLDALLVEAGEGTSLHRELLAGAISSLDEQGDTLMRGYAQAYLRHYGGNRRMESYLEARIQFYESKIKDESRDLPRYGL